MKVLLFFTLIILCFSKTIIPIGGSLLNGSPILNIFENKHVAFITAADPNPVGVRAEYQRFFDRRGIKATWVPIFEPCIRASNDPSVAKIINDADAVYMTGGYSDKLQKCLFGDTETYTNTLVLQALQKKNLIAGSSAGAMVQPYGPMLMTRNPIESYGAVVQRRVPVSARAFNIFNRGLVDVHFSERGRQGRLFVLSFLTKSKYSFGIDENTGIIELENGDIRFVGQKGTVVFQDVHSMDNGTIHYLTEGDVLKKDGSIVYPAWKSSCLGNVKPRASTNIFTEFLARSLEVAKYEKLEKYSGFVGRSPIVKVDLQRTAASKTMCGTYNGTSYVSFSNMHVGMGTTTKEILGFEADEPIFNEKNYIDK